MDFEIDSRIIDFIDDLRWYIFPNSRHLEYVRQLAKDVSPLEDLDCVLNLLLDRKTFDYYRVFFLRELYFINAEAIKNMELWKLITEGKSQSGPTNLVYFALLVNLDTETWLKLPRNNDNRLYTAINKHIFHWKRYISGVGQLNERSLQKYDGFNYFSIYEHNLYDHRFKDYTDGKSMSFEEYQRIEQKDNICPIHTIKDFMRPDDMKHVIRMRGYIIQPEEEFNLFFAETLTKYLLRNGLIEFRKKYVYILPEFEPYISDCGPKIKALRQLVSI